MEKYEDKVRYWLRVLSTSTRDTFRIHGKDYPRDYVQNRLKGIKEEDVISIAHNVAQREENIKNVNAYICSSLLRAAESKAEVHEPSYNSEAFKAKAKNVPEYTPRSMNEWKHREREWRRENKELQDQIDRLKNKLT